MKGDQAGFLIFGELGLFPGEPAYRTGGVVDGAADAQLNFATSEFVDNVFRITERPSQTVKFGHYDCVAGPAGCQCLPESGPCPVGAGEALVGEDPRHEALEHGAHIRHLFHAGLCSSTIAEILPCMADPTSQTPLLRDRLVCERARISAQIAAMEQTLKAMDAVLGDLALEA